jgi:hypothetical protein
MSSVGDALSGSSGSGASGVNDTTFSDATLGDQMMGGGGSLFGGGDTTASSSGGFTSFNDMMNAISSGGLGANSAAAQSLSSPSAAASATGGDPVGAASGTQSSTTPGSAPANLNQPQPGQGQQQNQQQQDHAPPSAVNELKALIKQLSGKPTGPTGPIAAPASQQQGLAQVVASAQRPSNIQPANMQGAASIPAYGAGADQPGVDAASSIPAYGAGDAAQDPGGGLRNAVRQLIGSQPTGSDSAAPPPAAADQNTPIGGGAGNAQEAPSGTPAAPSPTQVVQPASTPVDGQGRDITVRKAAQPAVATADLPTKTGGLPLPTRKGGPVPAPQGPPPAQQPPTDTHSNIQPSRLIQDIAGISTGNPTALADLAQAAGIILPLVGMFMGGGRRGRFGRFHGGRFTHGVGGGGHPGRFGHPAWRGAWPYHHPQFGWDMHHTHPGGGWRPLSPMDAQSMGINPQQGGNQPMFGSGGSSGGGGASGSWTGQDGAGNGGDGGQPGAGADDAYRSSGLGDNPFINALVGQESEGGQNIVSKTDKDSQGRTLARGGNPNEISQGYFQIQNHPGGTWDTYARQAGVDLNKYPTPRSAPLDVQWRVAQIIPIGQWGRDTKNLLRSKFGAFDPRMTLGEVSSQFGRGGSRFAAPQPTETSGSPAPPPAPIPDDINANVG